MGLASLNPLRSRREETENLTRLAGALTRTRAPILVALLRLARNRAAWISFLFLLAMIALCVVGPLVSPWSLDTTDALMSNRPPGLRHWLGTDFLGRDVLARLMAAGRISLSVGFVAMLLSVVLGVVVLAAQWVGGHPGSGLVSLAIMSGFGALILLGGRSETIRGLRGDGRDERFRKMDIHATALAGLAVIMAIIVAFVVELARGHSGAPYTWLGAIGGLTYLAAIIVFRIRG